jgi:hypothetical protein
MEKTEVSEDLRALCPKTMAQLLSCSHCRMIASRWREHRSHSWARVLYCEPCGKDWVVCGQCCKISTPFLTKVQISAHHRHSHDNRKRPPPYLSAEQDDAQTKKSKDDETVGGVLLDSPEKWVETRNSPWKQNREASLLLPRTQREQDGGDRSVVCKLFRKTSSMRDFGNSQSTAYFNADINGCGMADIVGMCSFGISEIGNSIHPADVQYATDMGGFIHGLTRAQRDNLSCFLASTVAKVQRDLQTGPKKSTALWKTSIPTNKEVMRRQFWEGKRAFLSNIPCPTVHRLKSHAYTSLRDCIRDRLAFGFPLESVDVRDEDGTMPVRTLTQSRSSQAVLRQCQDLYNEPVLVLFMKEWQDGYDPHAMSKNNRGSCWVKLVTISEPHTHRNSPEVRSCENSVPCQTS